MKKIKKFWICFRHTIRQTFRYYSEGNMSVYAANAAFFLELSAVPLIILLLSMVRLFPALSPEHIREALLSAFPEVPLISDAISGLARELEQDSTATLSVISMLVMLSSASYGVYAIIQGLWRLYKIPEEGMIRSRMVAVIHTVVMLLLAVLAIGTWLMAGVAVEALNANSYLASLRKYTDSIIRALKYCRLFTVLGSFLLVLSLYLFPFHRKARIRDQVPGALLTAILWLISSKIFAFYISRFWNASMVYGSLTAIVLISFWVLILTTVLFLGAAFNLALDDLRLPDYLEMILKKLPKPKKAGKASKQ